MRKILTVGFSLLLGALISAFVLLWFAAGEIYDYQDTFVLERDSAQIDVVLCLAGGKGRIPAAVELWQKVKATGSRSRPLVLYLSGVGPHTDDDTLIEQGVPREVVKNMRKEEVVFEKVSTNTFENAQIFSSFVHQKQWDHVLLVTTGYHMRRSAEILKKAVGPGISVYTSTVDAEHFSRREWHRDGYAIRVTMIEYIKWLYYRYSYW